MVNPASFIAANSVPLKLIMQQDKAYSDGMFHPIHIMLCPTNACNKRCEFCSFKDRNTKQSLTLEEMKKLAVDLKSLGTKAITITGGGEPLMHPQINEAIQAFLDQGIKIGLTTNGLLINKLKTSGCTWCRISYSGDMEINPEIFTDAVHTFRETDWAFSYVLDKNFNYSRLRRCIEYANKHNFTHVRLVTDILDSDNAPKLSYVKETISDLDISRVIMQDRGAFEHGASNCYISLVRPTIGADGNIYPCCGAMYANSGPRDWPAHFSMGHISEITKIWSEQKVFNGEQCSKCYYGDYNRVMDKTVKPISHLEFI